MSTDEKLMHLERNVAIAIFMGAKHVHAEGGKRMLFWKGKNISIDELPDYSDGTPESERFLFTVLEKIRERIRLQNNICRIVTSDTGDKSITRVQLRYYYLFAANIIEIDSDDFGGWDKAHLLFAAIGEFCFKYAEYAESFKVAGNVHDNPNMAEKR